MTKIRFGRRLVDEGKSSRRWDAATLAQQGRFADSELRADISVVVVTYNSEAFISRLIGSLRVAASKNSLRLIVVDNSSSDRTWEVVSKNDDVILTGSGGNVGYSAGINLGLSLVGNCDFVLILNPDLEIAPDSVEQLIHSAREDGVGAVVPLILDEAGAIYPSLAREPSVMKSLFDAVFTRRICERFGIPSESDLTASSYSTCHDVDAAMGAALLVPIDVAQAVGKWNESFFLYSEEIDYFRRIREKNLRIVFQPGAVVEHRSGGSGTSADLESLKAVNRIRYIESCHGKVYSVAYRATVVLRHVLRSADPVHRHILARVASRERWHELPRGTSGAE